MKDKALADYLSQQEQNQLPYNFLTLPIKDPMASPALNAGNAYCTTEEQAAEDNSENNSTNKPTTSYLPLTDTTSCSHHMYE
eukprot:15365301-Ditylum_brightwellii.AAC.1